MPAAAPIATAMSADSTIERLTMSSSVATSGRGEYASTAATPPRRSGSATSVEEPSLAVWM